MKKILFIILILIIFLLHTSLLTASQIYYSVKHSKGNIIFFEVRGVQYLPMQIRNNTTDLIAWKQVNNDYLFFYVKSKMKATNMCAFIGSYGTASYFYGTRLPKTVRDYYNFKPNGKHKTRFYSDLYYGNVMTEKTVRDTIGVKP